MPFYNTLSDDDWDNKIEVFYQFFSCCTLCPRKCKVQRSKNKSGICGCSDELKIASYNLHFGEEPPISGKSGSGTIFFSGCTMKCVYCQNYPLSQLSHGKYYSPEQLSDVFLYLQQKEAHNINLVSPTPYLYQILQALRLASKKGLNIPIVYNTSGYENIEIIKGLAGVVDIYMPDFKYSNNAISFKFSSVKNYYDNALKSIKEMYRQVGLLQTDKFGIAIKGIIIRHLILPGFVENSTKVLKMLADSNLNNCYLSLMSQYFPAYRALDFPEIARRVNKQEYTKVKEIALRYKFKNGWFQDI